MREILFRGKRLDNGEWIEGGFYKEAYSNRTHITYWNSFGLGFMDSREVIPKTVSQFTGVTDKNGRKVFEGDILAIKFHPQYVNRVCWDGPPDAIAKVFWDFSGFRLNATNGEDRRYPALVDVNFKETEVIGNIHDNKLEDFNGN